MSLGDGWFQATPTGTGQTTRCGLHSVLESSSNQWFMCIYEPRTPEAIYACTSTCPLFDLEVSAKVMRTKVNPKSPSVNSNFQIVVAFKSVSDYVTITCDLIGLRWVMTRVIDGTENAVAESIDSTIKANTFYCLLIQIRENSISVDINSIPVFTAVRLSDTENLSGLVGLFAKVHTTFYSTCAYLLNFSVPKLFELRILSLQ